MFAPRFGLSSGDQTAATGTWSSGIPPTVFAEYHNSMGNSWSLPIGLMVTPLGLTDADDSIRVWTLGIFTGALLHLGPVQIGPILHFFEAFSYGQGGIVTLRNGGSEQEFARAGGMSLASTQGVALRVGLRTGPLQWTVAAGYESPLSSSRRSLYWTADLGWGL